MDIYVFINFLWFLNIKDSACVIPDYPPKKKP